MTNAALTPRALPAPEKMLGWLDDVTTSALDRARASVDALKANPPGDALTTLQRWNDIQIDMGHVGSLGSLFGEIHPLPEVRERAEQAMQDVQRFGTELGLDADLYAVFAALDPAGLDPVATRLLDKTLLDFRRAGVDQDEETRARVRELQERLVVVGQEFSRAIREDVRSIRVRPDQLDGLPQDWIDAHPADADGLVTVTTDYPDVIPLRTFSRDAAARRDMTVTFLNVAWPDNDARLREIFALRAELAGLLGYADWADYDAQVKMIGSGTAIPEFIDRVTQAAEESGLRDRQVLLDRMRQDDPDATVIDGADVAYYSEVVRREQFEVDAQLVRQYFDFPKVVAGLLDVTGRLFGLHYAPALDAVLWDPDVHAYDVHLGADASAERIGRIYLDLHPRDGKYKHAAQFDLAPGVEGRQLAEGVLVCNFPRGLMEHDQVVTLFHEFGHLVHHVLGGGTPWARFSGVATEWDFVEAPSQMLEEWAWHPEVLRTFATNAAGEPIPAELVEKMRRADDFGKGFQARTQMFYASMSYYFHVEQPADLTARTRELQTAYSLFPYVEGTHMSCAFGHLEGYGSGYYTYMWSLVIAKDMFSAFDEANLFDAGVATRYRDRVLRMGGQRDAADLVADFLGRPYTVDAYEAWLAT